MKRNFFFCYQASFNQPLIPKPRTESVVFYTHDKQYVIKKIRDRELKDFAKIGMSYYDYITKAGNEDTLLVKIVGIFSTTAKADFIVVIMRNVLPDDKKLQQLYELRGPFDRHVNIIEPPSIHQILIY